MKELHIWKTRVLELLRYFGPRSFSKIYNYAIIILMLYPKNTDRPPTARHLKSARGGE